jgi:hypothetical protein
MKVVTLAIAALLISTAAPAFAEGKHTGFSSDSGQGNLNNDNVQNNNGTVTVSGPKGQIDKDNTDCHNCESSGPGNSQH